MLPLDVFIQALIYPLSRPWRCLLTALGTVLGVGMLVATLGITASARAQINQHFDELLATEVDAQNTATGTLATGFNSGGVERVRRLTGVLDAGVLRQLPNGISVTMSPSVAAATASNNAGSSPQLYSASTGALGVLGPTLTRGRLYDSLEETRAAHVAIIGAAAANEMGITPREIPRTIYIDGSAFLVEGIIGHVQRRSEYLLSVVIPETTEQALFGVQVSAPPELVVSTRLGYADAVGAAIPDAFNPLAPLGVAVTTPPDASQLRQQVASDVSGLFVILAGIGLVVGMVGIANTTLVSVLERVPEIGLRRAIGARRGQVATQFLLESLALGAIGGLLGGAVGVCGVTAVAVGKGWSPVIPVWVYLSAPLLGGLTGVAAGVYPAARASRVEPVLALAR